MSHVLYISNYYRHLTQNLTCTRSMIFEAEAVWLTEKVDILLGEWFSFISDITTSPTINKIEIDKKLYDNHV